LPPPGKEYYRPLPFKSQTIINEVKKSSEGMETKYLTFSKDSDKMEKVITNKANLNDFGDGKILYYEHQTTIRGEELL